jgi:adenylosuccinate synthase
VADLVDPEVLREKINFACAEKNPVLSGVYGKPTLDAGELFVQYTRFGEILGERIANGPLLINGEIRAGKRVMFEGAQATMLDIDHGTYPFVTSSNCTAGGIATGLGVAPKHIHEVMGVAKAYTTRVGGGAFPTELDTPQGEHLRKRGNEFGTVTGRPRRTGWLDLAVLRTAVMLNGLDSVALTKLDVLDEFDEIPVCVAYNVHGDPWRTFPAFAVAHHDFKPEYRTMKGWQTPIVGITSFDDLPERAKDYVRFIEDEIECRISIISTGPRREETIVGR